MLVRAALALLRTVIAAWRAATPRHFVYTFVLALAWGGVLTATATAFFAHAVSLGPAINGLLTMQFNGFAVLLAVLVVDHVASPFERRAWPYVLAVVAGVAMGTSTLWLVSQRLFDLSGAYYHGAGLEPFDSFAFRHGRHALVVCGIVTFAYVSARWAAQRHAALRRLRLECLAAEKEIVESTFVATRANVDPAFLQDALARIEALYDARPAEADALLRDLIASLRAAIPRTPAAGPTLVSARHPMA